VRLVTERNGGRRGDGLLIAAVTDDWAAEREPQFDLLGSVP
jgi:hypothetical protein